MNHLHPVQIGNVTVPNNVWLGPMAGVTDLPFRLLCKEAGAGLVSMEMVSAKAITFRNKKTALLMHSAPEERPVSLQLFGSEPDVFYRAVQMLRGWGVTYDLLDINMGCPVPKIVNNGEGSALMKDPGRIKEIVAACVEAEEVGSGTDAADAPHPVTVKLRAGFDAAHLNAAACAKAAEEGGARAVALHARTREQYYSGSADWALIQNVRETIRIPLIGSGDVKDADSALQMLDTTGCDGVMIARAAQGNPWIFGEVCAFLRDKTRLMRPDDRAQCALILRHIGLLREEKGDDLAVRQMRKHLSWYTAGRPNSAKLRAELNAITDIETLQNACRRIFDKGEKPAYNT